MLAIFGTIQSRPVYTSGQLTETTWHYDNWTVQSHVSKSKIQSANRGGRVGKQADNSVNDYGLSSAVMG